MPCIVRILKKLPFLFVILSAFLLISCGKSGQKSVRSGYYIEEPSRSSSAESLPVKAPQIHYLFDRTQSMEGYVAKGDSEYIRIVPRLWMVAESSSLWPESETSASFYKYGEGDVRRVTRVFVRDNVRRRSFYNSAADGTLVFSSGNKQVFATVARYIASESSPDKLFIITTDLYEQNREDNCFSALFKDAFEKGLSGAIIAVQSGFNGSIENISDNLAANIRVNGISTFFIFVIGHRDTLIKYCDALFATADFQSLNSEKVLFLLGDDKKPADLPWTPEFRNANSEKVFARIANDNNINLKDGIPKLFTVNGNAVDPLKAASFRMIGNVRSQYIGGLPVRNVDLNSHDYEALFTVDYCAGGRIAEGNLSEFNKISEKGISAIAVYGSTVDKMDARRYPLAVAINTNNSSMNKGCYRINYEIIQKAIVPLWVKNLNTDRLSELNESVNPNTAVRILRLESIYGYIAEAYNSRSEWGRVYFDTLYLEKQR